MLSGLLIFIAAQAGNVCRFLLQMFLVRNLDAKNYSELEALFSLLLIGSSPVYILTPVICRYVAKYKALNDTAKIKSFLLNAFKILTFAGLVAIAAILGASPYLKEFLKIDTFVPFIWVAVIIFMTFLYPASFGSIQGMQYFAFMSLSLLLPALVKLISAVILVNMGFAKSGVLLSYFLAASIMISIPIFAMRKFIFAKKNPATIDYKEIIRYTLPILFSMQLFFVLIYIDTILVKHFFDNNLAAVYASMAMLGKIVLFLPIAIFSVLLPKVSEQYTLGNCTKHLLYNTLKIVISVNLLLVILYYFFPTQIITLLFKGKYLQGADILFYFALSMSFFNLSITLMIYNMGRENNIFLLPFTIAALSLPTVIWFFHENLKQVISNICVVAFLLFLISLILTITTHDKA